jgi:hypothetical protein
MRGTAQVELEWLQIRVETETAVHEERYSVVEQCQKLVKLADTEEAALLQQFPQVTTTSIYFQRLRVRLRRCTNRASQLPNHHPQPQIMIRKQEKSKPTESKHGGTKTKGKKAGKKGAWEVTMNRSAHPIHIHDHE